MDFFFMIQSKIFKVIRFDPDNLMKLKCII